MVIVPLYIMVIAELIQQGKISHTFLRLGGAGYQ
jgi:hypothetical protein